jgi:hypothetical protein
MSAGSSKYEAIDVITTIRQTIEVPLGVDRQDILKFLAQEQNFRDAFRGTRCDARDMVIQDIEVINEEFDV